MKRFYKFLVIALTGVIALGAYSCENVNMNDIMVTPSTIDVKYSLEAPSPIRIAVTAGHDWYVQSTADWITVNESSISSTGFTITLDKYHGEGTDTRSGVVLVSSKVGQWPVVINQERLPYSTYEEYLGTYRVTMNQRKFVQNGDVYDEIITPYDFLADLVDDRANKTDNLLMEDFMPWGMSMSQDDLFCNLDINFIPETSELQIMQYAYNWIYLYWGILEIPCKYTLYAAWVNNAGNLNPIEIPAMRIDTETGKFSFPSTINTDEGVKTIDYFYYSYDGVTGRLSDYAFDVTFEMVQPAGAPVVGYAMGNGGAELAEIPADFDVKATDTLKVQESDIKKK